MSTDKPEDRFRISLYQNGVHSLRQGLEAYRDFNLGGEPIQLKDAIMGLHHGVELLLKEILVRHNEFLIFEDLKDVAKKKRNADRVGLGIFFIEKPPRTVTFIEAISRVKAFIKPEELDDNLDRLLRELNQIRNQLEHYTVDADIEEIDQLIADIHEPLINLFTTAFGQLPELQEESVEEIWQAARSRRSEMSGLALSVLELLESFDGQLASGRLFSRREDVKLPKFSSIHQDYSVPDWPIHRFDIFAESESTQWAIEVRSKIGRGRSGTDLLLDIGNLAGAVNARPWLVLGTPVSKDLRKTARSINVMLSDSGDLEELENNIYQDRLF